MMKDMFDLSPEIRQAIEDMGYENPTPIQESAIPPLLEGRDVIGQAQTGTGKTAAFGIPMAEKAEPGAGEVRYLVLCPTRELAMQTAGELNKLTRHKANVGVACVYGGVPIERQIFQLQHGAQIVVGTPGRLLDHMNRGTLDLSRVRLAVLDEADEMLDMGFRDDISAILAATPAERQTALFSATMPAPILALSRQYLRDPVRLEMEHAELTVEKIQQFYINVRSFHKGELLSRLLTLENIRLALVFCNTRQGVEGVVTDLQKRGFSAAGLHGDMRQIERDAVMERYRRGLVNVLVATDVAARGLDIDDIQAVFNYDIPLDVEYYVHRIGRTGRAGKEGTAYTFVVGREVSRMWDYRRITGAKILCRKAPDGQQVRQALHDRLTEGILAAARDGASDADGSISVMADRLLAAAEPRQLICAMLAALSQQAGARVDLSIDLDPPAPEKPPRPVSPVTRRGPYGRPAPAGSGAQDGKPPRHGPRQPRYDRPQGERDHGIRPHGDAPRHPAHAAASRPRRADRANTPRRITGKK